MTRPTQGHGLNGLPLCHNATPRADYLANFGYDAEGRMVKRTIPWAFSDGCKSWASDPSTDPVPLAESWNCKGCRHFPVEAFARALLNREARACKAKG